MNLLITGGTGFIGKALCDYLQQRGHQLCVLTRDLKRARFRLPQAEIRLITDLNEIGDEEKISAVVNLAGEPILQRWTATAKRRLVESRIDTTQALLTTFRRLKEPPEILVSGSAVGFYGPHHDEILSEEGEATASFSHELCEQWEARANQAKDLGLRVCLLRTGIVLNKQGGALARMTLPFLLGLGGKIGKGSQGMSWVHLQDMVRIIEFCIMEKKMDGPVNATAPTPVTNEMFTQTLGKILHRPTFLAMPEMIIKGGFGQMGEELLLQGQRVMPEKLLHNGFTFHYPTLESALNEIFKR